MRRYHLAEMARDRDSFSRTDSTLAGRRGPAGWRKSRFRIVQGLEATYHLTIVD